MLIDLCTKQSLLPAYSRLLSVYAPSSPSQGVIRPPLPLCQVGSSSSEYSIPLLLSTTC